MQLFENVSCCKSGRAGFSMKISVASIMTLVDGYFSLKTVGILERKRAFGANRNLLELQVE